MFGIKLEYKGSGKFISETSFENFSKIWILAFEWSEPEKGYTLVLII